MKSLTNINKITINVIEVNNKIIKLYKYEKIIKNSIYKKYWKKIIYIELKILYLNNT